MLKVAAKWLAVGCVVSLMLTASAHGAELKVGDKAPAWKNLKGTDDKEHSLGDVKKAKAVVVAFTCNHCPVAVAYEDRFIEFTKKYKDKGVAFVAINVNNLPADRLDQMKVRAEQKGFNFTYLYDPSQKIARDYSARVTPHMYVLDGKRKVAYIGAFDNSQKRAKVESHYVRDAVDAVLAGTTPEVTAKKAFGCTIKYE